jgi:hypothetical protein
VPARAGAGLDPDGSDARAEACAHRGAGSGKAPTDRLDSANTIQMLDFLALQLHRRD